MNILIVDDNVNVRHMIKEMLADFVNEIYECSDGLSAVEFYQKHQPDVVLMDIKMKKLNGLLATERIMRIDAKAKVIIVSNYDDDFMRTETKRIGAIQYFKKEDIHKLPEYIKVISKN
ncbi:MAG: two-component system response regulator stage 0 sporulation protein F [Stygiobacter sp.]|nr:MAG: two-component system response regulator stage 0 sporulation protein F [Stygiobacter sp.]KAF0212198.1 MAG: two-component system response regulator stage 0 sporulation protein [Ignavibacteria bacterium]